MLKDIRTIFGSRGCSFKDYMGTFGIEIETETYYPKDYPKDFFTLVGHEKGLQKFAVPSTLWYAIEDHSLRNFGREFVLVEPLDLEKTLYALDDFESITKGIPFISNPPGASVHVHVNMLPETLMTLANFISLWVYFETPLIEFCGVPRRTNLFALPVRAAEGGLQHYQRLFQYIHEKQDFPFSSFSEEAAKYSALNIATLSRLGTVEIRTMRGTTDKNVLGTWVTLLNNMLTFAKTPGLTPYYILQEIKEDSSDLLLRVFGPTGAAFLQNPHWKSQVERNLHYLYSLVDAIPSWDHFGEYEVGNMKKSRLTKKKPEPLQPFDQYLQGDISLATLTQIMSGMNGPSSDEDDEDLIALLSEDHSEITLGQPTPQPVVPINLDEEYQF